MRKYLSPAIAGFCAGGVTGLFGAGGGMILIPLLTLLTNTEEDSLFSTSLCVMLPVCLTAICFLSAEHTLPWAAALPYLITGAAGGLAAGKWGHRIPVKWLHRGLGLMILWGGLRYLC